MSLNGQQAMAVLFSLLLVFSTVAPSAAASLGGKAQSGLTGDSPGDEGKWNGQKSGNGPGEKGSSGEKNASSGNGKNGGNAKNGENGKNGGSRKNGENENGKAGKKGESPANETNNETGKKNGNGKAERPGHGKAGRPGNGPGNVVNGPANRGGSEQRKKGRGRENGTVDCGLFTEARNESKNGSKGGAGPPANCGKKPVFGGEAYVDTDLTPLELRLTAWGLIDSANVSSKWNEETISDDDRTELRSRLNETFAYYVGRNRTNDSRVMKADHEVAAKTGRKLPNVTAHLVVANRKLAETATDDAESVFDALETRNESFRESEAREHIDKANAALAQAEHVRNASTRSTSAIVHYRRAWSHAQRALDVMDAATEPSVTLDRRDPRHDGPINYTVQGRVFDVRAYQLDEVTVTVNGESRTVPAEVKNVTPGTSAAFVAEIRLDSSVNDITVVVSDSGEPLSNRSDSFEPNTATAQFALDADGLPDRYERNALGTDPLDSDSNAVETSRDEADDNVSDYEADFDGDFLSNGEEYRLETDPLVNDTDGDRLHDDFEVLVVGTDPLTNDTDGNGTTDDLEDADGDGLTNYEEQRANSDPTRSDTDGEDIADPDELINGTDPSNPDTDGDGLTDFEEPQRPFETDPLDPDTDDDGVRDGNETYTTTASNESVGATVSVTDEGNAAADVNVAGESEAGFDNPSLADASKSTVTSVRSERNLTEATVELAYDESAVSDESDLAAFVYSTDEQRFVELPSTVNEDENTVTADTDRDGTFVVMSTTEWASNFRENVSEYSVEKDTFDDPGASCEGICKSDGESVSVGVIRGGTTASTQATMRTQSFDSVRPKETRRVTANGTTYRNGPASFSTGRKSDTLDVATADSQRDSDWIGMTFATRSLSNAGDIDFYGDLSGYANPNATARVVVVNDGRKDVVYQFSAGDSKRSVSHRSIHEDLSEYAGETVKFRLEIKGPGGGLTIHGWQIVEDTDGDGVPDETDLCTSTAGYQDNGCPPSSLSVLDLNFDHDVEKIRIEADVSSVVETSGSKVVFEREGPPKDEFGRNPSNLQTLYEHDTTGRNSDSVTDVARDLEAGETVTLRIRAKGTALISLDSLNVKIDRDGDGLWDRVERQCIETQRFGCVDTDISEADTDDDDVPDGQEVGDQRVDFVGGERNVYFQLNSHPNRTDTDEDGLDDGTESDTWEVDIVRDGSGDPYKYDAEDETSEEMEVSSSPLWKDTDGDGANDTVEKRKLKTDPEKEITYGITEDHQEEIVDRLSRLYNSSHHYKGSSKRLGILGGRSVDSIHTLELNDTSDDFDFVRADDGDITFTALNGAERTDTWLSNREEADQDLSVWDPDTDDDGLTDGQEAKWLTVTVGGSESLSVLTYSSLNEKEGLFGTDHRFPTEPDEADSDDDDYWDGWIGVYGVGNSSNVVLYQEHLQTGDGIEGDEIVQEQTGVHEMDEAPSARGAKISDKDTRYHSNVHLGELHWGTDPDDDTSSAYGKTSLEVEVDYIEGRNPFTSSKNGVSLFTAVENNYGLYGLEVEFHEGEKLEIDELERKCKSTDDSANWVCNQAPNYHPAPKITPLELNRHEVEKIEDYYHDDESKMHLLWGTSLGQDSPKTAVDIALELQDVDLGNSDAMAFTNGAPGTELWSTVSDNDFGVVMANDTLGTFDGTKSVLMHELGHTLGAGYADDDDIAVRGIGVQRGLEVYSGDVDGDHLGEDTTPEYVIINGRQRAEWSIMRRGTATDTSRTATSVPRFAFSLEELSTIDFKHVPSKDKL